MEIDDALAADLFDDPIELALDDPAAPTNGEGDKVIRGQNEYNMTYYCGIIKGKKVIPGSDGRCGPTNGPACPACKAYLALHPIEDQFAHLAMNPGQLARAAQDPVQGPIDMNEDPDNADSSDDDSVKSNSPRYPEKMDYELVTKLVRKKFPTDSHAVMGYCTRIGGPLDQFGIEKMPKLVGASCWNGNGWNQKKDNRITSVVKLLGLQVDGLKCRGCNPEGRCGDVLEENSTSFDKITCGCAKKLSAGLLTVHKDLQCRNETAPTQAAHARKTVENEKEHIRNSGFRLANDFHYASASLLELKGFLDRIHVLWVMGGNVNHGMYALRNSGEDKRRLLEDYILQGRIVVVGNSAGAMCWGSRLDSNRDADQQMLGNNFAGLGFFADLSIVPHTTMERLEHHHRQNKVTIQQPLVFDPAGTMPNRVAPLVDQMALVRVGPEMCYVYQSANALDKRRRYASVSSFPSNYLTAETVTGDFELHPNYSARMDLMDEALAAEEDAILAERQRCKAEAEQLENEIHEKKMREVRDAAHAAAVARAAAEEVKIEQAKAEAKRLATEQSAALLKEQINKANAEAKAEARAKSRAATKAADEARLEACDAQDRLKIKVEEAERAEVVEQEQKDNINCLTPSGPSYKKRLIKAQLDTALAIIRIDPALTKGRGAQAYPLKCNYFCNFLKEIELYEKRGAFQFHEMADLTPQDMVSIEEMVIRSEGRLRAAYHREGFKDVKNHQARIYGSVTITYHTLVPDYNRPTRNRYGASSLKNFDYKPEPVVPCDQNQEYVLANAKLDEVRKEGMPIDEQLAIKEGNKIREVMNDMDDLTHATKGPECRARARRRAEVDREKNEEWLVDAEQRLLLQVDATSWIKPEYLPTTEAEVKEERKTVLRWLCDLLQDDMRYEGNARFKGNGFLDLEKRIKIRVPKPHDWTLSMMKEANENARRATSLEPLLDKLQPPAPGVDVNSSKYWYTGRYVVEASEEEDLRDRRFSVLLVPPLRSSVGALA